MDDDYGFCENLWQILRDRDYRVCVAHSEAGGIGLATESAYEVAIVDLQLGAGDGRRVIQRIRQVNSNARVIVITGDDDLDRDDADIVLSKPINMDALLNVLDDEWPIR